MNVEIVANLNAILEFEDLRFLVELGAGFLRLCKIHDSYGFVLKFDHS